MTYQGIQPDRGYMGDRRRGASLGRVNVRPNGGDWTEEGKRFHVRRVRLDSGGYDSGGAYWGIGAPLYHFESEDGAASGFVRIGRPEITAAFQARGGVRIGEPGYSDFYAKFPNWHRDGAREAAKDHVRETYPAARFFR